MTINTNLVTVLKSPNQCRKTINMGDVIGFQSGSHFKPEFHQVENIRDLSKLLFQLEAEPNKFIVLGQPRMISNSSKDSINRRFKIKSNDITSVSIDAVKENLKSLKGQDSVVLKHGIEYLKSIRHLHESDIDYQDFVYNLGWSFINPEPPAFHSDRQVQSVCFDIDKLKASELKHKIGSREAADEIYRKCLPECFHDVSYHYQWSSSAGLKNKANIHFWLYLSEPYWISELKKISTKMKKTHPKVDPALYNPVQPHYTAKPEFLFMADPIKNRSGFVSNEHDSLDLSAYLIERTTLGDVKNKHPDMAYYNKVHEVSFFDLVRDYKTKMSSDDPKKRLKGTKETDLSCFFKTKTKQYLKRGSAGNNRGAMAFAVCVEAFMQGATNGEVLEWINSINLDGERSPSRLLRNSREAAWRNIQNGELVDKPTSKERRERTSTVTAEQNRNLFKQLAGERKCTDFQ